MAANSKVMQEDLDLRYKKLNLRASGGFGRVDVYGIKEEYVNSGFRERVVVKLIQDEDERSADREIKNLTKLSNEGNVVRMLGHTRYPHKIILECINTDLGTYAVKQKQFNLTVKDLLKLSQDMLGCIKTLEKYGIIHRDVKPANFLVNFCGTDGSNVQLIMLKICDLGCSRIINLAKMMRGELRDLTTELGTDGFMSPEILRLLVGDDIEGSYTTLVDIWGFGATLLFLSTMGLRPLDKLFLTRLHTDISVDSMRDAFMQSKIREWVPDNLSDIRKILGEVLKFSPSNRKSVDQCIALVEFTDKHLLPTPPKITEALEPIKVESVAPPILTNGVSLPEEEILRLPLKRGDWKCILNVKDKPLTLQDVKSLAEALFKQNKGKIVLKQNTSQRLKDMDIKKLINDIMNEYKERYPDTATVSSLLNALEDSGLSEAAHLVLKHKKGTCGSSTHTEELEEGISIYKAAIRNHETIVVQLRPFSSINEILPEVKRDKDLNKLFITRTYKQENTNEKINDINDLFKHSKRSTLVKGPPGMGKTKLYEYLLLKWANNEALEQFTFVVSFSCRTIKEGVEENIDDIFFSFSSMDNINQTNQNIDFSFENIKKLAEQNKVLILIDGLDELDVKLDPINLKKIKQKVKCAHADKTIKLSGTEAVIGFLADELLPGAKILVTGRIQSIDELDEKLFRPKLPQYEIQISNVYNPEREVALGTEGRGPICAQILVIQLSSFVQSLANKYEILEFEDKDIKVMAHALICDENSSHNGEDQSAACVQTYQRVLQLSATKNLRRVPYFSKVLVEIEFARIKSGSLPEVNSINISSILTDLLYTRVQEHCRINKDMLFGFESLLDNDSTKPVAMGLKSLARVAFDAIVSGNIVSKGTIVIKSDEKIVRVCKEKIPMTILQSIGLFKLSLSQANKVDMTPEHLSILEYLGALYMACFVNDIKDMRSGLESMNKERIAVITKFMAQLLSSNLELVKDLLMMMAGPTLDARSKLLKLQQLYALILSMKEDLIPNSDEDVELVEVSINGRIINKIKRRSDFLKTLVDESKTQLDSMGFQTFLESTNKSTSTNPELRSLEFHASVKEDCLKNAEDTSSPSSDVATWNLHINSTKRSEAGKTWLYYAEPDYRTIQLVTEIFPSCTLTCHDLQCCGQFPAGLATSGLIRLMSGSTTLQLWDDFRCNELPKVMSAMASHARRGTLAMQKINLRTPVKEVDPNHLAAFLATTREVKIWSEAKLSINHYKTIATEVQHRMGNDTAVMEVFDVVGPVGQQHQHYIDIIQANLRKFIDTPETTPLLHQEAQPSCQLGQNAPQSPEQRPRRAQSTACCRCHLF